MNLSSLPPLCLSVRVTECNPVEAQIDPALGNRAAQTNGQLCAEKSGTQTEAPSTLKIMIPYIYGVNKD